NQREPDVTNPIVTPKIAVQQPPVPIKPHERDPAEPTTPDTNERLAPLPHPVQPAAKDTLNSLIAQLRHPDHQARLEAAKSLSEKGPSAHPAIHALVPLLDDLDVEVKTQATKAIIAIGRTKASGVV